jgi:UDP-perosamine 4-acetyltransferase
MFCNTAGRNTHSLASFGRVRGPSAPHRRKPSATIERRKERERKVERGDRRVLIAGAGGHAKVVVDVLRMTGWYPAGFLDRQGASSPSFDLPVLGSDDDAARLYAGGLRYAFAAIGQNGLRGLSFERLRAVGYELPTIIHPAAVVSSEAHLGMGVLVMPCAIINAGAIVGSYAIINSGAIVEHDCRVGRASHIAPRAVLGGSCIIGDEVLFGIGAVARPQTRIGSHATVGAGSTVVSDVGSGETVVGNPARKTTRRP